MRYCGRNFTPTEIDLIRELLNTPKINRVRLSRAVCERLGWRRDNGALKDMSCRVALLRMQADGLIGLPARCRPDRRRPRLGRERLEAQTPGPAHRLDHTPATRQPAPRREQCPLPDPAVDPLQKSRLAHPCLGEPTLARRLARPLRLSTGLARNLRREASLYRHLLQGCQLAAHRRYPGPRQARHPASQRLADQEHLDLSVRARLPAPTLQRID